MSSTLEHAPADAAVARPRRSAWLIWPVTAGVVVFGLNNFLLARLLTALPGGTVLAPTTMAAVAFVALRVRRAGAVTLVYATYGVLGVLGHLGVDAGTYVFHLPRVLAAAAAFDLVLALSSFRRRALPLGLLPCAGILLFAGGLPVRGWLVALLLAAVGLAGGLLLAEGMRPGRGTAPASGDVPTETS